MASRDRRLDALTGARFLAAFHVFVFHMWSGHGLPLTLRKIEQAGVMAVTLFFVLSGFVLTVSYGVRDRFDLREFAVARFARIAPLYLLCLLASIPVYFREAPHVPALHTAVDWLKALLLVQNWWPNHTPTLALIAWSLSIEAFFYLLFPFLLPAVRRLDLVACLVGFTILAALYVPFRGLAPLNFEVAALRLPEFLLGMLAGRLYALNRLKPRSATMLFYGALLSSFVIPQFVPIGSQVGGGALAAAFALLVLALASFDGFPARLLRSGPLVFLGGASYALYLFHPTVFVVLRETFGRFGLSTNGGLFAVAATGLALTSAALLFRFVEEPARAALRRRLSRRPLPEPSALQSEPL